MTTQQPFWEQVGMAFVREYYNSYDTLAKKEDMANFYHSSALMTFEDKQSQGPVAIREAFGKITFQSIAHKVTKVDCQPTSDGILIQVTGRLQTDEDHPHAFAQTFLLRHLDDRFYICHDIFRLSLHDTL